MLVSRTLLYKQIRTLESFDSKGSPFVGLQWGVSSPLFHRSGPAGYIETVGYRPVAPDLVVSVSHLKEILGGIGDDAIDLSTDRTGVLVVRSGCAPHESLLHVHTVRQTITWAKTHEPGDPTVTIDPIGFSGINTTSFDLVSQPVLRQGKLMLATNSGIVMRSDVPVTAYPYPRESFLRAVSPLQISKLYLTKNGYWGAEAGGFNVMISGHRSGDEIFDTFNRGAETLAELPAKRLSYALAQAAAIAGKGSRVTVDPTAGLIVMNPYGHEDRLAIGESSGWERFSIATGTATTLADVLKQGSEETALLQRVDAENLRITRGAWSVSFKYS